MDRPLFKPETAKRALRAAFSADFCGRKSRSADGTALRAALSALARPAPERY
jgi:hypothetical protein